MTNTFLQDLTILKDFYNTLTDKLNTTKQYTFSTDNDVFNFMQSVFNSAGFAIASNSKNVKNNYYFVNFWQQKTDYLQKDHGVDIDVIVQKVNDTTLKLMYLTFTLDVNKRQCPKFIKDVFKTTDNVQVKLNTFNFTFSNYDNDGIVLCIVNDYCNNFVI